MKKIILSLICLLAVCVCAGAACATSDVDNMAIDDSAVPHDTFVSMDVDHNLVSSSNQNACDLDNSIAGDDLVNVDPVSVTNDNSAIDLEDTYFQSVKWIIPAEYLNPCINFTIPELSPTVSDITDNSVNTIIRVEKNIRPGSFDGYLGHF